MLPLAQIHLINFICIYEVEPAKTYRDLAEHERDEKRQGVLLRMAEAFGDDLDRHHRVGG
ncbi:MAG: hypothetical protein DME31_00780 [Verrucomicrobia bacterium]|nr:MAG: hypothetical protein DME31_00780 [Verrucomicrobiota bacterium]PYL31409.1 MAG: hypothetical protein DMF39_02955 [Verrucomicrobiota bacterium]